MNKMKKFIVQALSLMLALSLLSPIPTPTGSGNAPPDEEPGVSVCGDGWRDGRTKK